MVIFCVCDGRVVDDGWPYFEVVAEDDILSNIELKRRSRIKTHGDSLKDIELVK